MYAKAKYRIDLTNERDRQLEPKNGGFLRVVNASSSSAAIKVAIDDGLSDDDYYTLQRGDWIRVRPGFDRLFLKNTAQAGEWVELLVTGDLEDFEVGIAPRGEVNSIAEPVTVKGGNTLAYGNNTVASGTQEEIIAADSTTTKWTVQNASGSAGTAYVGSDGDVDNTNGIELLPGQSATFDTSDAVHVWAQGGDCDIRFFKGSKA